MAIKKNRFHNIIVLTIAVLIASFMILIPRQKQQSKNLTYKVYYNVKGWGYDILVNNKIIIHQEIVPAITTQQGFTTKAEAEKAAGLVIQKIRSGKSSALSVSDIQGILAENEIKQ